MTASSKQRFLHNRITPFFIYLVASLFFFGRGLFANFPSNFSAYHIGRGADPDLMMWCLVWWPHAIASHLNPFVTKALWAPFGFNLTWTTSIPIVALVASPLTIFLGPAVSYNLLCLLSIPLAAWSAFLLCHYLSNAYWPAILGGFVFGFSPPFLGQLLFGHMHVLFIFAVPLAVYYSARYFNGEIRRLRFALTLAVFLVIEFLCSIEIFATFTLLAAMTMALGWLFCDQTARMRIVRTGCLIGISYAITAILVSPFLYYFFVIGSPYSGIVWNSAPLSADLLNFFIPTPLNEIGRLPWFRAASPNFSLGNPSQAVAYVGWPLIALAVLFARKHGREPLGRLLIDSLVIILVLSLGPLLHIGGKMEPVGLPAALLHFSVFKNVLFAMFGVYASLILAVIVTLWFPTIRTDNTSRLLIAVLIVGFLLPNLKSSYWLHPVERPSFFDRGTYRDYLSRGDTALLLPFWPHGDALFWQAQTKMYFRLAGGTGPWPKQVQAWPIISGFYQQTYIPNARGQLAAYLQNVHARWVIVADSGASTWRPLVNKLGVTPIHVGGVWLYRLPQARHVPTLSEMRTDYDTRRFDHVLFEINNYLRNGGKLKSLFARNAVELGLIPDDSLVGAAGFVPPGFRQGALKLFDHRDYRYGIFLFVQPDHRIALGESVWRPTARLLINRYGHVAAETHFVLPLTVSRKAANTSPNATGSIIMAFTSEGIKKAAAIADKSKQETRAIESSFSVHEHGPRTIVDAVPMNRTKR